MKIFLIISLVFIQFVSFSQKKPLEVSGSITINNNGIDPVPAFALGKPALMSSIFITKGNFIFNSMFNYSITEGKPWSQNIWFLYKVPISEKSYFRTGLSLSFFHKKESLNLAGFTNLNGQILNQYPAFEASFHHKVSEKVQMSFTNWAVRGIEKDAVRWGNFTNFAVNISEIKIGKELKLGVSPSTFFVTNAAPFKGFFVAETTTLFYKNHKIGLINQIVQPIYTEPETKLIWNLGLMWKI
jgi:hypothetical protein